MSKPKSWSSSDLGDVERRAEAAANRKQRRAEKQATQKANNDAKVAKLIEDGVPPDRPCPKCGRSEKGTGAHSSQQCEGPADAVQAYRAEAPAKAKQAKEAKQTQEEGEEKVRGKKQKRKDRGEAILERLGLSRST